MSTIIASNLQASGGTGTAATLASINGGPIAGSRQRLINGDMRIDQRNAGAAVTPGTGTYSIDRWRGYSSQASKFTLQQNAGSVTPPAGFTNYLGAVSSAATTPGTNDLYLIQQFIEGYNVSDLAWGTSSAQSITLSFWVRSSLTGTFGASIQNDLGDRSYGLTFSINSANTWEYKSVVIPGPTTGTWNTTTGKGLVLSFLLGCGSTSIPSANSTWLNANYYGAIGATNVVATNGATFYLTGVQLEAGTVSTPFERRSYAHELMLAQRYFCKPNNGSASGYGRSHGYDLATSRGPLFLPLPVQPMRATPSISIGSQFAINDSGSSFGSGATVVAGGDAGQVYLYVTFTSQPAAGAMVSLGASSITASAEL